METPEEGTGGAGHENSDDGEEEGKHKFIVQNGKIFVYHIYFKSMLYSSGPPAGKCHFRFV